MSGTSVVVVGDKGRVVIPGELRKELQLNAGDQLLASVHDGVLELVRPKDALDRIRQRLSKTSGSLSEELIAERRVEAQTEP